MSSREHRVTCAIKWHYLEGLDAPEIRDRMEEEGLGDYAVSTIRSYLQEQEAKEAIEMIEQEHANTRLQIAEHEQQLFERAREAERTATEDEPIIAMVPKTALNEGDGSIEVPDWRVLEADDPAAPDWATERDTIIEFTDHLTVIDPGEPYPKRSITGEPLYQKTVVGLQRDVPDEQTRQSMRYEQSKHLQNKGEVLGVYSDSIEIDATVETTNTHELGEDEKQQLDQLFGSKE